MKITHKLILLILLGFIGNVVISVVGLRQLSVTSAGVQYVIENTLPSFNTLNSIDHEFMSARIALRSHVMATTSQQKQMWETKYRNAITQAVKAFDTYGTNKYGSELLSDETDRQYYQKARDLFESYSKSAEDMISTSNAGHITEAVEMLDSQAKLAGDVSTALSADIDYNHKLASTFKSQSMESYQSARTSAISITVAMSLLLCGIGIFIYRQLNSGLTTALSTISKIQDTHDFTLRATINGNDEISKMLQAFNQLISRMHTNLIDILTGVDRVTQTADS